MIMMCQLKYFFAFQRKIISIMTTCFNSVKHKLSHGLGYFDLLGFDFMLDREFNVSGK